ncbi:PTS fructose transporter subunit IIC [Streptomyces sp. SID13726]|uniref:PTS fructose transporter subunit IIC n=1 Tax=Streptomyces sp. SID13726 TaxID=2706058 RepID=UPI0013B9878A|nr:PTS fructose transporter subunit IIC [Streptomyces sp. SID13726]NEA99023.1 PTS fructose transporter subunit IIC [Streptomyces sp. SID13726]
MDNLEKGGHIGIRLGRWLASSTPYIASLTVIGGLLTVLGFAIGGPGTTADMASLLNDGSWTQPDTWAALLLRTGISALALFAPVVAGYVAYGLAGRSALVPGVIGGIVAMSFQGGFLIGLITGVTAGAVTRLLQRIPVPSALRRFVARAGLGDIASITVVPLLSTVVTTAVVFVGVGPRFSALSLWLNQELPPLTWGSTLVCGLVLGLMASSDLSGTIGKTAMGFAATGVETAPNSLNFTIMATVVTASMVPPLAMSLATAVRRSMFTPAERTYGKAAWLFGVASLPEGAIPFAVADPLRVLPASMAGGAVTGALTMTFGCTLKFPYGGVFAAGYLGKPLLFGAAIAAGIVVTTALVLALKSLRRTVPAKTTASARATRKKILVAR